MVIWLWVVFNFALAIQEIYGQNCVEPSKGGSMYVKLYSRRNQTGYHNVEITLQTNAEAGVGATDLAVMDASQKVIFCNGFEIYTTRLEVSAPPPIFRTEGYELVPGFGYYKFFAKSETWENAVRMCIRENAHLMIVNSEAEAGILKGFASRKNTIEGATWANWMYSGFHDRGVEGQFITVLGDPMNKTGYNNWHPQQPDNKPWGTEGDQDCGAISFGGLLQDLPCLGKLPFICEQPI